MVSRELLNAFVFFKNEPHLFHLLEENPELDAYVVPMLSLVAALQALMTIELIGNDTEYLSERLTVALSSAPEGGIQASIRQAAREHLLTVAARMAVGFLNEKGYELLTVLAEDNPLTAERVRLGGYQTALRMLLDEGKDDNWLIARQESLPLEDGYVEQERARDCFFLLFKEMLCAETHKALQALEREHAWMQSYRAGIPMAFDKGSVNMRRVVAAFCFADSWLIRKRLLQGQAGLLTDEAVALLQRIQEIAAAQGGIEDVQRWLADWASNNLAVLRRCRQEGVQMGMFREAPSYVMGAYRMADNRQNGCQ